MCLDYPYAVMARGFCLIFSCVVHAIIALLCVVIRNKFEHLTEKTDLTVAICSSMSTSAKYPPNSVRASIYNFRFILVNTFTI